MCLGDIKLALQAGTFTTIVNCGIEPTKVVSASPDRVGLIISSTRSIDILIGFEADAADSTGLLLPRFAPPLIFSLAEHGSLVQKGIYISTAAGTVDVFIWQTIFSDLASAIARL